MLSILVHLLPLPADLALRIDTFLGEQTYWHARHQLTLYNARLNLFHSQWWMSWYTHFCWHHWHLRNPQCVHPNQKKIVHDLTKTEHLPLQCGWIVREDKRVLLLLRLFKTSIYDEKLVPTLSLQLRIYMEHWSIMAKQYSAIVY